MLRSAMVGAAWPPRNSAFSPPADGEVAAAGLTACPEPSSGWSHVSSITCSDCCNVFLAADTMAGLGVRPMAGDRTSWRTIPADGEEGREAREKDTESTVKKLAKW